MYKMMWCQQCAVFSFQARGYLQSLPFKPKVPWAKLYPSADPKGRKHFIRRLHDGLLFHCDITAVVSSYINSVVFLQPWIYWTKCWHSIHTRESRWRKRWRTRTWSSTLTQQMRYSFFCRSSLPDNGTPTANNEFQRWFLWNSLWGWLLPPWGGALPLQWRNQQNPKTWKWLSCQYLASPKWGIHTSFSLCSR